jgi:fumarylpyruvate hydrolase
MPSFETAYVFEPEEHTVLPVHQESAGGAGLLFPVNNVYCVGQNYAAHAREMRADPEHSPPVFFRKPTDSLLPACDSQGEPRLVNLPYPPQTNELHHEVELVAALKGGGRNIPRAEAEECIFGYGVGLDMTRRDLQAVARKAGMPWDMAKGFDDAAPCSALSPVSRCGHPDRGAIRLAVNGESRQKADLGDLIWNAPEAIVFLSRLVTLRPGDLIFTGTPEGVGPVLRGDRLEGHISGVGEISAVIV